MKKVDTKKLSDLQKDIEKNREELVNLQHEAIDYIKRIDHLCRMANVDLCDEFMPLVQAVEEVDMANVIERPQMVATKYAYPRSKKSKAYQLYKLLRNTTLPLTLSEIMEQTGFKYATVTQYLSKYDCFVRSGDGYLVKAVEPNENFQMKK